MDSVRSIPNQGPARPSSQISRPSQPSSASPARPASPGAGADRVSLSASEGESGLFGLHTLQAYPENGGPQLERSQQLSSGGRWMTEAASLKSISNSSDPVSRQRREALLDTIGWAHDHGLKMNVRLDYDWGQNVPQDEAGRREYASMMRDFVRDARARTGDDTVANWVVGNEPNLAHENGGRVLPPQDYVAAVQAVRRALDADPATRPANLASAGLSPGGSDPQRYFQGMLEAGIGDSVGTYGVHEYADRLDNLDSYDQLAQRYGAAHPLAITEFGVPRRGIDAQQQAAQTTDFIHQIARRNQTPGKSPVQNVTLWKANRGPGEEAFSLTPEMLSALSGLRREGPDTRALEDNFRGLFDPPVGGMGAGSGTSGKGAAPVSGTGGGSGGSGVGPVSGAAPSASQPPNPDERLQSQSRQVMRQLQDPESSGEANPGGAPASAQQLQRDYADALQDQTDLKPQTHQDVGRALQAAGLPNPAGPPAGPSPPTPGSPSAPPPSAPPSSAPATAAAVTSPQRTVPSNAPLPAPDPSKPLAVSHILENRDPRLPDNPPGIEGFIKDKDGKPIDARGLTIRFDGGAEPYYIPIVNKPEKGPGYYEVPLIVPGGFKGRYNVAVGRKDGDSFIPLSNTANVEVTRDHRRTQVDFQAQA